VRPKNFPKSGEGVKEEREAKKKNVFLSKEKWPSLFRSEKKTLVPQSDNEK